MRAMTTIQPTDPTSAVDIRTLGKMLLVKISTCTMWWIFRVIYGARPVACRQARLPHFFDPCVLSYTLDLSFGAIKPAAKRV